ncbi:tyrosine-protein phosphatase [Pedobacter gandavensis]|uniref:tyrosine-protein phosphatase n=1 Tax=Pedobacter gandavensis TaxID=2679963 RepID=UPI00292F258F|nr:CpsB/CapC family capsule biosynthesis tyrosine phosphatase [Pedobacter gandavensis]
MFSFFNKKTHIDHIEWLGVDMHSHWLPGIDDGAKDMATALNFMKSLQELGFKKLLATPHIFTELYPNDRVIIENTLESTSQALTAASIKLDIGAGAEYMVNEDFEITNNLVCLPNKHILIEMSYVSEMPNIEQIIFNLQVKGYVVILAHPERYSFYQDKHQRFHRFKEMGVLFQLNLLSISGYYGKDVKRLAEYLLQKNYYDLAGTDLHHDKHLQALRVEIQSGRLFAKLGNVDFKNMELFF